MQKKYDSEEKIVKRIDKLRTKAEQMSLRANTLDAEADALRNNERKFEEELHERRTEAARLRKKAFHIRHTQLPRLGDALSRIRTPMLECCKDMSNTVTA